LVVNESAHKNTGDNDRTWKKKKRGKSQDTKDEKEEKNKKIK